MWTITGTQDEASFLDDLVFEVVTSEDPLLPPADSKLGHVELHWDNVGDGKVWLQARGGSVDDRRLAREVLEAQLASHGFVLATLDLDTFQRTADWNKIMDKARRLLSDGAVQVLRNGYNNIVAQVRGDHGNYQSEIFRQDPNSRAITGSDCECGWGEFQNQPRTRQWKRYQDRPCSHILAAFWQAQSMPLDEDAHPDAQGPQDGSGGPSGAPTMGPEADQGFDPAQRSFDPSMAMGQSAPMGAPQGGAEEPTGPSPADVLPQYPMENMPQPPPTNPVSNPAFTVGPTPTNPVSMPPGGTFSSVQDPWEMLDNSWHFAAERLSPENVFEHIYQTHRQPEPDLWNTDDGESAFDGWDTDGGDEADGWHATEQSVHQHPAYELQHVPIDQVHSFGYQTQPQRIQEYKQQMTEAPPIVLDSGYGIIDGEHRLEAARQRGDTHIPAYVGLDPEEHTAAAGDGDSAFQLPPDTEPVAPPPMKSGDLVQLRYPDTGVLQGRSAEHGAGQETDLAPGMVGEYLGRDPSTLMHSVLWMGKQWDKNKEMEPYGALGVHFDSYLIPRPDLRKPGPAVRRRR